MGEGLKNKPSTEQAKLEKFSKKADKRLLLARFFREGTVRHFAGKSGQ